MVFRMTIALAFADGRMESSAASTIGATSTCWTSRRRSAISSASDAFLDVTRRQALAKWKFRPATRDGVPYETWRSMTVRFVLEG